MYVVTFYSFKGGVGRTQALVNVGVELVKRGRRVLLVDFDLEAPGIDTYQIAHSPAPTPGIVEYISAYIRSGIAPDARDYMYESRLAEATGSLWVMPSGLQDDSYGSQLTGIDWVNLYEKHDGYLLMEDLKLQWDRLAAPDYVLIDSRTGHTDVGGICTRQLPDAVVVVFFPNHQNLVGLSKVVSDIRAEATGPRQKSIGLHFVMSNVPVLDDEEKILANHERLFRETLGYKQLTAVHRYESLSLLDQVVFTSERPNTRLAREYRKLADIIIESNVQDREGALAFLSRLEAHHHEIQKQGLTPEVIEGRIAGAQAAHPNDPDILLAVATLRVRHARWKEAIPLLNRAAAGGLESADLWLARGEAKFFADDQHSAAEDLARVLNSPDAEHFHLVRAFGLLRQANPNILRELGRSRGISALNFESQLWIAIQLDQGEEELLAAEGILRNLSTSPQVDQEVLQEAEETLCLRLIGLRRFDEAIEKLKSLSDQGIKTAFNLAMAVWGKTLVAPVDLFAAVLDLDRQAGESSLTGPNYDQCLALACAIAGSKDDAMTRVASARTGVVAHAAFVYSCWRYQTTGIQEFMADLDELSRFITEGDPLPLVLREGNVRSQSESN